MGCPHDGGRRGRYNLIGYHVGTVWPFDNSFIAWGFADTASRKRPCCCRGHLGGGGVLRRTAARGVRRLSARYDEIPSAAIHRVQLRKRGRPGAPLLLLRTMLGLEPVGNNLVVDAALPKHIGRLELLDIPGRWDKIDALGRGRVDTQLDTLEKRRRTSAGLAPT